MKTCYWCKGPLKRQRIEHMHEWAGQRFLIRNVSAEVCTQCGEAFLSPSTLKAIDRVVAEGRPRQSVSIPVFELKPRAA